MLGITTYCTEQSFNKGAEGPNDDAAPSGVGAGLSTKSIRARSLTQICLTNLIPTSHVHASACYDLPELGQDLYHLSWYTGPVPPELERWRLRLDLCQPVLLA